MSVLDSKLNELENVSKSLINELHNNKDRMSFKNEELEELNNSDLKYGDKVIFEGVLHVYIGMCEVNGEDRIIISPNEWDIHTRESGYVPCKMVPMVEKYKHFTISEISQKLGVSDTNLSINLNELGYE